MNKTICSPTIPLGAIRAGRPPCRKTISMNVAAVVAEVVVDHHSRQHVEHRSNQEVRAEEGFFSYPRIPYNPHAHPTMTAIEFSCEKIKSMKERVFESDDRD